MVGVTQPFSRGWTWRFSKKDVLKYHPILFNVISILILDYLPNIESEPSYESTESLFTDKIVTPKAIKDKVFILFIFLMFVVISEL